MLTQVCRTLIVVAGFSLAFHCRVMGQTSLQCRKAANCTSCILAGPLCAWCFQQNFFMTSRCDFVQVLESKGCNRSNVFVSKSEVFIVQDDYHRDADLQETRPAVQLRPQHIRVRLVPGNPARFSLRFRVAVDYPVDLYYLMDTSLSMEDDLQSLSKLGADLQLALLNKTRNVRLGFGAFVDKPIKPFIDVRPEALQKPCHPIRECTAPYGFVNRLALTNDTSLFVSRVNSSSVSGNLDTSEGGLDALVQAITCQKHIEWRDQSRKMLLFATDGVSHISGDGKLAGIVEPNDGKCHLIEDRHEKSSTTDYPSIGQIAKLVRENAVHVIFAITQKEMNFYQDIAKFIPGSALAILADNSSNVVEIIKNNYKAIVSKVSLVVDGLDGNDPVALTAYSSCGSGSSGETTTCDHLGLGQEVSFDVQLNLTSCPTSATSGYKMHRVIFLSTVGIAERTRVDVDIDCNCECSDEVHDIAVCSSHGRYSCGSCYCDAGFVGSRCECEDVGSSAAALQRQCIRPGSSQPCSGRGTCTVCGTCDCGCLPRADTEENPCFLSHRYSGQYCECNPNGCNSYNDLICAGQGICRCDAKGENYCECNENFENGAFGACECPRSADSCKSNTSEAVLCSGKGVCTCGVCRCLDNCYTGMTCNTLKPECSGSCQEFRPCVECSQMNEKSCLDGCQNVSVNILNSVAPGSLQTCYFVDDNSCEMTFALFFDHSVGRYRLDVLNDRKCPPNLVIPLVCGIIGTTFIIGIFLLLTWKVVVTLNDRKEYTKFQEETQRVEWTSETNPLFKSATITYINPTYTEQTPRLAFN